MDITEEILDNLADGRLEVFDDATHYLPIEHPRSLAHELKTFIARAEAD